MAPHRRRTRILFIALAHSSHTQGWISLLDAKEFHIKVFGVANTRLPDGVPIEAVVPPTLNLARRFGRRVLRKLAGRELVSLETKALADVLLKWRPDIVHTLGLDPASYFFLDVTRRL